MAEIAPPDARTGSPCMCVIVYRADPNMKSPCHRTTSGPDVPFCDDCEDRHPLETEHNIVTTKPLPRQETPHD